MLRKFCWVVFILFSALNIVAFMHAYKFTHFSGTRSERTKDPKELSPLIKTKVLLTGIDNPKPTHKEVPRMSFKTIQIKSDVMLEAWHLTTTPSRGTVILFHGYSGEKSALISRAEEFAKLGYNTLLADFMGSGGSEGVSTNLGYTESLEVKDCYDYVRSLGEDEIHLFGTSMGAAAILKAFCDYRLEPSSIILECPFGTLYEAVSARFTMMGVPSVPMAAILTFWGGFQQGYWAFSHNPDQYAKYVKVPTLLMYGEKDDRVSLDETTRIYNALNGSKKLVTYPDIGHHIFVPENEKNWVRDVSQFVNSVSHKTNDAIVEVEKK